MFAVTRIIGNKVLVDYQDISFYVYVDKNEDREYISKPRSIFIKDEAFKELIRIVFESYRSRMNNNAESKG